KLDLASADARQVQQVVDQPAQVLRLPVDDVPFPLELGIGRSFDAKELDGIADGREWVAQLMRQNRQELVLAPVGLCQLLDALAQPMFQLLAFRNIPKMGGENGRLAGRNASDG